MAKIFITGIAGFLGSHLADAFLATGHTVVGNDNLIGGEPANVPRGVDFYELDCRDLDRLRSAMAGSDVVFHCAATAYEGLSVFSPFIVTEHIVGASVATISAAVSCGVKRIVYCSSMARYGAGVPPFHETDQCRPQDPYGIGKVAGEQFLRNLCDVHRVQWVIAVPHNIIGPRQKYDDPYRNVASIMMNVCLQGRQPVIYGDGTQRRCFSYVTDCLQCLTKMAFGQDIVGHTINIGPDEGSVEINELFDIIADITNYPGEPIYMPDRPQEVKVATCSSNKARMLLDYKTQVKLRDGLILMRDAMLDRGPKPFKYHLPIEIITEKTPKTWTEQLF